MSILNFSSNEAADSFNESTLQGEKFASTIAAISSGQYVPNKKEYPTFKKSFWEEQIYNPRLLTKDQAHGMDYHVVETQRSWEKSGVTWKTEVRFPKEKIQTEAGPTKPVEFKQFFESPEKYWGRNRAILPFTRARLYQCPVERHDDSIVRVCITKRTTIQVTITCVY